LPTQPRRALTSLSGKATGRRRCFGGRILFFPEQLPVQVKRLAVKELDAAMIGLEGALGGFNWSSQHPQEGSCDAYSKAAIRSVGTSGFVFTWSPACLTTG